MCLPKLRMVLEREGPDIEKQGKNKKKHSTNSWKKQFQHQATPQPEDDHRLPQYSIGKTPDFQNTPDNGHLSILHDLVEPRTAMTSRPPGPFSLSGSANWPLMHPQRQIDGPYSLVTRAPRSPWRATWGRAEGDVAESRCRGRRLYIDEHRVPSRFSSLAPWETSASYNAPLAQPGGRFNRARSHAPDIIRSLSRIRGRPWPRESDPNGKYSVQSRRSCIFGGGVAFGDAGLPSPAGPRRWRGEKGSCVGMGIVWCASDGLTS